MFYVKLRLRSSLNINFNKINTDKYDKKSTR